MPDHDSADLRGMFAHGGSLGRRLVEYDWAASPLGPIETWSPALLNAVSLLLPARAQIVLFWGPQYVAIYNDAYAPSIGDKHPDALGRPAVESWGELWDDLEPLLRQVRETGQTVSASDRPFYIERHGFGEEVFFDISYSPVRDGEDAVEGVLCIVSETTERVRAERRQGAERDRLAQMFEQAPGFMALLEGPEHVFTLANRSYQQLIGHRDVLGKPVREALPDIAGQGFYELLDQVYATGEPFAGQAAPVMLQRSPDGPAEDRRLDFVYQPVRDAEGRPVGIFVQGHDVTDRVRATEARRESEARLQTIADSIDQMIWSTRPDGHHDYYNRRWYDYTGMPDGSTDGEAWNGMFHPDDQERAWSVWRHSLETGEPYHIEYRLRRRDGQYRWVLGRAQPVRGEDGAIVRWYGTCTDIHDLKLAEEAVRQTEERYRLALRATNDAVWDWDLARNEVFWNEALSEAYGYAQRDIEMSGDWWIEQIHPDDRQRVDAAIRMAIEGSAAAWSDAYRFRRADGTYADVLDRGTVVRDADGRARRMIGAMLDLSRLNRAEAALRESEDRLRLATEAADVGTWDLNPVTGELHWDARCKALFGLSPEAPVTYEAAFLAGLHPEDRAATQAAVDAALAPGGSGAYNVEYRSIGLEDGIERWIAAKGRGVFEDGEPVRFIGTVIDISGRKRAEAALAAESHALEILNRTAAEVAAELDADTLVQTVVDAGRELTGARFGAFFYTVHDEGGESLTLYALSGAERAAFADFPMPRNTKVFAPTFDGEGVVRSDDITKDKRYGRNRPYRGMPKSHLPVRSYLAVPVISRSGEVIGGLFFGHEDEGVFGDRAERLMSGLAAQAAIGIDNARLFQTAQRANQTLEAMVEERTAERDRLWMLSEDLLVTAEVDGRLLRVSPSWSRVLGHDEITLTGEGARQLLHPEDADVVRDAVARMLESGRPARFQSRLQAADGGWRCIAWTLMPDPDGGRYYGVGRDVTEEQAKAEALAEAEERLRQAQKMEAVGQLTGGVAHDFNNLLQIVTGNLETLQRNLAEDSPRLRRAADNAMTGAKRAAVLTQRLLAFSRRQPLSPKPTDPNRLVAGMSELLHRTLGETIEIETVQGPSIWKIEVDPNQLESALLNLAINARDAMPEGGKLTIETANTHLDRQYAAENAEVLQGQYVVISVSDTGVGMNAETLQRVFEPFFTTKEVGRGTGLGLSMVYGFVKQSGGHVKVYSEPGQGTTVRVYLPRLVGEAESEEEQPAPLVPEGAASETILVCEDDDDVRAYSVDVLRDLGYRVLEAHDGPSALRLLERAEGRVDLLFTDVVLPGGMTGADLARQAQALRPGLKVLFTTGYARNAIVHHGRLDPGVELITKPFAYADLAGRIRDLLDAPTTL